MYLLEPTAKAKAYLNQARAVMHVSERYLMAALTQREQSALLMSVAKLQASLPMS